MPSKTWEEKLTWEQKQQVTKELRTFGLDSRQIRSLMNSRCRVKEIELILMRDMPNTPRGRPTIGSVKGAISSCKKLGLLEQKGEVK